MTLQYLKQVCCNMETVYKCCICFFLRKTLKGSSPHPMMQPRTRYVPVLLGRVWAASCQPGLLGRVWGPSCQPGLLGRVWAPSCQPGLLGRVWAPSCQPGLLGRVWGPSCQPGLLGRVWGPSCQPGLLIGCDLLWHGVY